MVLRMAIYVAHLRRWYQLGGFTKQAELQEGLRAGTQSGRGCSKHGWARVEFLSGKKEEGKRLLKKATALASWNARKKTETIIWAKVSPAQSLT